MALSPWEPFEEMMRAPVEGTLSLRDAMNRLLEESFIGHRWLEPLSRFPLVDVREIDHEYVIEASLPGVKSGEMEITATQNTVTIRATRKPEEKTEQVGRYVRRERYQGEMIRTIGLPVAIDPDKVTASYNDGILTLHAPKTEAAKGKQINVEIQQPATVH